jgi:hypothetical protein
MLRRREAGEGVVLEHMSVGEVKELRFVQQSSESLKPRGLWLSYPGKWAEFCGVTREALYRGLGYAKNFGISRLLSCSPFLVASTVMKMNNKAAGYNSNSNAASNESYNSNYLIEIKDGENTLSAHETWMCKLAFTTLEKMMAETGHISTYKDLLLFIAKLIDDVLEYSRETKFNLGKFETDMIAYTTDLYAVDKYVEGILLPTLGSILAQAKEIVTGDPKYLGVWFQYISVYLKRFDILFEMRKDGGIPPELHDITPGDIINDIYVTAGQIIDIYDGSEVKSEYHNHCVAIRDKIGDPKSFKSIDWDAASSLIEDIRLKQQEAITADATRNGTDPRRPLIIWTDR